MSNWIAKSNAWPGGQEIKRDGGLDPKEMTAKGRFFLRAVERDERIASTLFEKAHQPFNEALAFVDMDIIEQDTKGWLILKSAFFWEQLGVSLRKDLANIENFLPLDDIVKKRFLARWKLINVIVEWADEWRLDRGIVFHFATAVLIEGPLYSSPQTAFSFPTQLNAQNKKDRRPTILGKVFVTPASAWKVVANEYLKIALSEMIPQEAKEICLPPPGFELYVGRGAEEFIDRQVKNAEFWCSGKANLPIPFVGLPSALKKQIVEWVRDEAEKYCARVDAALKEKGATMKRVEPTFARDLEWTVERRILNWEWERIARESNMGRDTIKKGVRKMLDLIGLPLYPSFEAGKGRKKKEIKP